MQTACQLRPGSPDSLRAGDSRWYARTVKENWPAGVPADQNVITLHAPGNTQRIPFYGVLRPARSASALARLTTSGSPPASTTCFIASATAAASLATSFSAIAIAVRPASSFTAESFNSATTNERLLAAGTRPSTSNTSCFSSGRWHASSAWRHISIRCGVGTFSCRAMRI